MRALVLSGGGVKGAFEVGVLRKLLDEEKVDYDIYCGVSVGALNASFLATGPLSETLPELEKVWFGIKGNHSIWKHNLFKKLIYAGILISSLFLLSFFSFIFNYHKLITITLFVCGILSFYSIYIIFNKTKSVYLNSPLKKLVYDGLNIKKLQNSGKKLRVGAFAYEIAEYQDGKTEYPNIKDWVIASSAFPIFFPMEKIGKYNYTDGGVTDIAPLRDAIEAGANKIDIILASPTFDNKVDGVPGILTQALRIIDCMSTAILLDDLKAVQRTNKYIASGQITDKKMIETRLFMPKKNLIENSLNFSPIEIKRMYEEGRNVPLTTNS